MIHIDVDFVQRIKVTGIFFLQIYKIFTGTLLTLFIPQSCEVLINNTTQQTTQNQICTLKQNYYNTEKYHQITMYWNFFTMLLFFMYYIIELKRENWSIHYLDIDNDKPDNALKDIIRQDKILDTKMDRLNKWYYNTVCITILAYFINILLMINIIIQDYHSSTTVSCFISFSLLVMMKLYNSFIVARNSVKDDKMMSAYMSEFVSFNVLDADYIQSKNNRP